MLSGSQDPVQRCSVPDPFWPSQKSGWVRRRNRMLAGIQAFALGLVLLSGCSGAIPLPTGEIALGPADSFRFLYLAKAHRLVLPWENGDFEIWDTQHAERLVFEHLSRPAAWCLASSDEDIVVTGNRMPNMSDYLDSQAQLHGSFVPSIRIWDAKMGSLRHEISVTDAVGYRLYTWEWYPRWLDNERLLLVRGQRENPARVVDYTRLIVINTRTGKISAVSEEFENIGERVLLSPARKMALVLHNFLVPEGVAHGKEYEGYLAVLTDNYLGKPKNVGRLRYIRMVHNGETYVIELERLTRVSAWCQPWYIPLPPPDVQFAQWCPDGRTVLTVSGEWNSSANRPNPCVRLWDSGNGRLLQTFAGHTGEVDTAAMTSDSKKVVTGSEDRTVRVWDTRTGKVEAVLTGHTGGLNRVVILPGDELAVSAAEETTAKVWDLNGRKLKFDLPGHDSAVRDIEPVSGSIIRTVTVLGTVTTWDCSTGERLEVTPKRPEWPKRFGVCELTNDKEGIVHMYGPIQGTR
jgi:WD40 repeat protein